jgi:hypothetical protein
MSDDGKKEDAGLQKTAVSEDILVGEGFKIKTGEEIEITIMPKDSGVSE